LKRTWVWLAITFGLLTCILSLAVHLRAWQTFDWETLDALQAAFPRAVDAPFSLLTLIGSAEVTGIIFLAMVWRARPAQRVPLILAFGIATILELIGKTIINQPTTPHDLVRYTPLLPLPLSAKVHPGFSYPSGHALRATFLVIALIEMIAVSRLPRATKFALGALLLVFEAVMLVSRVYLAEHWLTDVIGGALLGAAFALIALARNPGG
jgi:membrane-associated phospholipid phosphatase